jgi:hypothetical protein
MALVQDIPFFINPLDDQPLDGRLERYRDRARLHIEECWEIKRGWAQNEGQLLGGGHFTVHDKSGLQLQSFENFSDPGFSKNMLDVRDATDKIRSAIEGGGSETSEIRAIKDTEFFIQFRMENHVYGAYTFSCRADERIPYGIDDNEKLPNIGCTRQTDDLQNEYDMSGNFYTWFNFDSMRKYIGEEKVGNSNIEKNIRIGQACFYNINNGGNAWGQSWDVYFTKDSNFYHDDRRHFVLGNLYMEHVDFSEETNEMLWLELNDDNWAYPILDTKNIPKYSFFRVIPWGGDGYYRIDNLYSLGSGVVAGKDTGNPLKGTNPLGIRQLPKWNTRQLFYKDRILVYSMGRDYSG